MMKVLVCDDEERLYREVEEAIKDSGADVEVVRLIEGELKAELVKLFERVDACLGNPQAYEATTDLVFDAVDLAIVDNNLADLRTTGARLTAEHIIGYVRAFTKVPYVVSLNKNPEVDFDLRYLVGDYQTRADIALNTEHLSNAALWSGKRTDAKSGFLPWYWPKLTLMPKRRSDQIALIRDLADPLFATLGLPTDDESLGFLSLHARGALSPDAQSDGSEEDGEGIAMEDLTFREVFLTRSRSLPTRVERQKLLDAADNGNAAVANVVARVVAADIDLWFRRDVIGPQEMLVDVPHLLMRMPFLLGAKAGDAAAWNRAIDEVKAPFGMDQTLFQAHLAKVKYEHDVWVPSPAFPWPALKANDELNSLFFSSNQDEWADVVFCEDRSEFLKRSPASDADAPKEFAAAFDGSWGRRHVAKIEGFRYKPQSYFAS